MITRDDHQRKLEFAIHQQMLDIAMLAFAQHCCPGQEDRKHRYVVDDLIDRDEPALLHVRVEPGAILQVSVNGPLTVLPVRAVTAADTGVVADADSVAPFQT